MNNHKSINNHVTACNCKKMTERMAAITCLLCFVKRGKIGNWCHCPRAGKKEPATRAGKQATGDKRRNPATAAKRGKTCNQCREGKHAVVFKSR